MALSVLKDPTQRSVQLWVRAFYILSNLILAFLGKGGLAVSIISKMKMVGDLTLLDHYQSVNVNVFLAASTVLIVIGWIGIFAGSRSCHRSTLVNAVLLGLFLVSTTAYTATTGVLTNYRQGSDLYRQMQRDMDNYNNEFNIVDKLHTKLSCCGLNDITTWDLNKIPGSCCRNHETQCVLGSPYLQTNGCFKEFIRTSRYYAWLIFSVLTSAGLIEIFAIMLSSVQYNIIKDREQKKRAALEKEDLKIPRPQVASVENEIQNSEKENEKEEKNRKKGKEQDKEVTKKEEEKKDKEEKEEKKEENENKKLTNKSWAIEVLDKAFAEKIKEAENSDKDDNVEETKQDTCRNVTSAHKNLANIVINVY